MKLYNKKKRRNRSKPAFWVSLVHDAAAFFRHAWILGSLLVAPPLVAMTAVPKLIPVSLLRLHGRNPRFSSNLGEQAAIAKIGEDNKTLELARDIASRGLSPLELIGVFRAGNHYIAAEGNRRLCALKLLLNPGLIAAPHAAAFRKAAGDNIALRRRLGARCSRHKRRREDGCASGISESKKGWASCLGQQGPKNATLDSPADRMHCPPGS